MFAASTNCAPTVQQRLLSVRRVIETTTCESLLPALELYALQLERTLNGKAPRQQLAGLGASPLCKYIVMRGVAELGEPVKAMLSFV